MLLRGTPKKAIMTPKGVSGDCLQQLLTLCTTLETSRCMGLSFVCLTLRHSIRQPLNFWATQDPSSSTN